eukprot:gene3288-6515_t
MAELNKGNGSNASSSSEDTSANGFFKRWASKSLVSRPVPGSLKALIAKPPSVAENLHLSASSITPPMSRSFSGVSEKVVSDSVPSPGKSYRVGQFEQILAAENVDLNALRKISWNGVPYEFKNMVWQLLLGYLPTNKSRRETTLQRKRKEYIDSIPVYFDIADSERTSQEGETLRQILVDLPRTCPDTPFFHQPIIQKAMERVLYIWSIRHPASGYVQGMNDLLTPLFLVSMFPFVDDVMRCDVATVDNKVMMDVEADAYWSLTKLLDNIQDHYTFSQPGLQRMVMRLEDLVHRIDAELHQHFEREGLHYMQFSFRWMNCLLLRELPLRVVMRLWDTYLSEERGGFENFHVYVCAVLLKTFRDKLLTMQFQDILILLQELPTTEWRDDDVEPVLSQAYILSTLFEDSPSHLA